MTRVIVDGVERPHDADRETWGELLSALETDLATAGRAVTATRFDGVDVPTYRGESQQAHPLQLFSSVEIDTVPTTALLRQGLSEAAGALETLCGAASRIGGEFRGHDVKGANTELVSLAQSLGTLVTLIGVVGQALDVDFEVFTVSGGSAKALFEETGSQIGSLVKAQQSQDWVAVADTLEYDVSPTLGRWRELLTALHERAGTPATV
jgi:hypothetical protein